MSGNRISHLGDPEQENDAIRLHFVNENFLRHDGGGWMRGDLSIGGFRVVGMSDPQEGQDGVNLRTLSSFESKCFGTSNHCC